MRCETPHNVDILTKHSYPRSMSEGTGHPATRLQGPIPKFGDSGHDSIDPAVIHRQGGKEMYRHILIPLDGSDEAEGVFPVVRDELEPDGRVILLRVIPPGKTRQMGGQFFPATQQEEADRTRAEAYLRGVRDSFRRRRRKLGLRDSRVGLGFRGHRGSRPRERCRSHSDVYARPPRVVRTHRQEHRERRGEESRRRCQSVQATGTLSSIVARTG